MERQLKHFTSWFLQLNTFVLFLLISFPVSIRLYSPPNDNFVVINRMFESIGGLCLLCWLFAIGHCANDKLLSKSVELSSFRFFNGVVLLLILSSLLYVFIGTTVHTGWHGLSLKYVGPVIIPVMSIVFYIVITVLTAEALVSAELGRQAKLNEYAGTFFLLLVPVIGLWFVQPRVQRI